MKNELIKIVDQHFNTTDQNPYIDDSTTARIANEIADYLTENEINDNVLTNLRDSSSACVEKIDSLIYKFSFPIAYMKRYAVFDDRDELYFRVDSGLNHFSPNIQTYRLTERLLLDELEMKSEKFLSILNEQSIRAYYRQYVYYNDVQGDSLVLINALCHIKGLPVDSCGKYILKLWDWKHELILVDDGGDCYWQTKINLTKRKCIYFSINGSG